MSKSKRVSIEVPSKTYLTICTEMFTCIFFVFSLEYYLNYSYSSSFYFARIWFSENYRWTSLHGESPDVCISVSFFNAHRNPQGWQLVWKVVCVTSTRMHVCNYVGRDWQNPWTKKTCWVHDAQNPWINKHFGCMTHKIPWKTQQFGMHNKDPPDVMVALAAPICRTAVRL